MHLYLSSSTELRCSFQAMWRVSNENQVQDPPKINLTCAMSFFLLSGQKPISPYSHANIQKKNNSIFLGGRVGGVDKLFNLAFDWKLHVKTDTSLRLKTLWLFNSQICYKKLQKTACLWITPAQQLFKGGIT